MQNSEKSLNTAEKILKKIDEEKIEPCPRWFFQAQNYFFWFLLSVLMLAGAIALDFAVFLNADILKINWIIIFLLLLAAGYCVFKRTKKGYRCGICSFAGAAGIVIIVLMLAVLSLGLIPGIYKILFSMVQ